MVRACGSHWPRMWLIKQDYERGGIPYMHAQEAPAERPRVLITTNARYLG